MEARTISFLSFSFSTRELWEALEVPPYMSKQIIRRKTATARKKI